MTALEFSNNLLATFAKNNLEFFAGEGVSEKLELLFHHMTAENKLYNLTSITDPQQVILRHFADSLTSAAKIPAGAVVLDVGCGAGFPSLPLAICRPDISIVALDSTAKKVAYVEKTAKLLGLSNMSAVCARAEEYAHLKRVRESFDVVVSRAVAELRVLTELCLPFVKKGGMFIAMKSKRSAEELEDSASAILLLGGEITQADDFELADNTEVLLRCNIYVTKKSPTPSDYPRNFSSIMKKKL